MYDRNVRSGALDNIRYSLCKENIKSCNAKRRRQRRRAMKNNNRSNQQKTFFARAAHFFCTLLCLCFARLQRETSRKFMEEMSYVFAFTFFHCRSFSPCIVGRQHFSILSPPQQHFHVVLPTKSVSFVFLSLALDLCRPFLVELR